MTIKGIDVIRQGGELPFVFDRDGESLDGWTCTISVKKHPADAALISRAVAADGSEWPSFLTQTETAALDPGTYYLTGKLVNTTEDQEQQVTLRFHVAPAWA